MGPRERDYPGEIPLVKSNWDRGYDGFVDLVVTCSKSRSVKNCRLNQAVPISVGNRFAAFPITPIKAASRPQRVPIISHISKTILRDLSCRLYEKDLRIGTGGPPFPHYQHHVSKIAHSSARQKSALIGVAYDIPYTRQAARVLTTGVRASTE